MLNRLEIPWATNELPVDEGTDVFIIIRKSDIEAGEQRNESLVKRIYKDNTTIVPPSEETEVKPGDNIYAANQAQADAVNDFINKE